MTRVNRLLLAVIAAVSAGSSVTPMAQAGPPPPTVPTTIQVPAGNKVFLVGHAVGVQIYSCNGAVWGFVAPRANLYGDNGKLIITHFGGPTWQAKDGSRVVGQAEAVVTVDPTAIAWVRLSAASTAAGRMATGWWPPATSNGSQPSAAWPHRPRNAPRRRQAPWPRSPTPPTTTSGKTPAADQTPVPAPAGRGNHNPVGSATSATGGDVQKLSARAHRARRRAAV